MSDHIQYVTQLDEYKQLVAGTCVVKFTDPSFCTPCRLLAPKYEELAERYDKLIKFVVVNTGQSPEICRSMKIRSIPIVIFYQEGTRRDDLIITGNRPDELEENVNVLISELFPENSAETSSETPSDSSEKSSDTSEKSSENSSDGSENSDEDRILESHEFPIEEKF